MALQGAIKRARRVRTTSPPPRRRKKVEQVYVHDIADMPNRKLLVTWDQSLNSLAGIAVSPSESRQAAAVAHGPYIVPVNGDDTQVWRCDWRTEINNYQCRLVDITSPEARL